MDSISDRDSAPSSGGSATSLLNHPGRDQRLVPISRAAYHRLAHPMINRRSRVSIAISTLR